MEKGGTTEEERDAAVAPQPDSALRLSIGRHPRDVLHLVVAAAAVALSSLAASVDRVTPLEEAIFREVGRLPSWTLPFWRGVIWAGSAFAIAGASGLALYMKRIRLGLKLVASGALSWSLAWVVGGLIEPRPVPAVLLADPSRIPGPEGFPFPSSRVAVAAALVTVALPYLGRSARIALWPAVVLVAVADVALGDHLPLGVVAGGFLGWGSGALLHLAWGAPGRRTSVEAIRRVLGRAGHDPVEVVPLRERLLGPLEFEVRTASGEMLLVQVVRRLHRRAGIAYKVRRFLASLEVEDQPNLSTPHHEAEHEALVTLLAERAGVRTPSVVVARELGHGPALLARVEVQGRRLPELGPEEVSDALLDEIWRQVDTLGRARIGHQDLRATKILVDEAGRPWILGFTFARAGAHDDRIAQDVGEMLVSLASLVGTERAVASACRVLPQPTRERALPFLQPLALPRRIREQLDDERLALTELRDTMAERIGCPPPAFKPRITPGTLLALAMGGGAVYLLLPQIGTVPQLLDAVRNAQFEWLVLALLAGVIGFPLAALAFLGASRFHLPLGKTTAVEVAAAFAGKVTPGGVGAVALDLIYLERLGLQRGNAVGVVALNRAAGVLLNGLLFVVAVAVLGSSESIGELPVPSGLPVLAGAAGVLVLVAIVLASPLGRRRIVRPTLRVTRDLLVTLSRPRQALLLVVGVVGLTMANALALVASLAAFEPNVSVLTVSAVYVAGAAVASAAPTPGNLGAVEAALVAGLRGVGIEFEPAVAAVLTFRLLTFWLPMLVGLVTFRHLQHRGVV